MDILSNKIIKILFPKIPQVISKLVTLYITQGLVPSQLKSDKVITIFKDGDKSSFNKGISTDTISYKNQFGFRAGYDTSYPLLHFTNNIKPALNLQDQIYNISIFIDLKKAFDTVPFD